MMRCVLWSIAVLHAAGLDVTLSAGKQKFTAADPVVVQVALSNPLPKSTQLLKWFAAVNAGNIFDSLFKVTLGNAPVKYVGPMGKLNGQYVTINANSVLSGTVDLAEFYDFSTTGTYTVRYDVAARGLFDAGDSTLQSLASNTLTLSVDGRINVKATLRAAAAAAAVPAAKSTSFNQCSAAQQTILNNARNSATTLAIDSNDYLQTQSYASTLRRYVTWFGSTGTYYNSVTSHYSTILNVLNTAAITFDCTCTSSAYAYVYSNQPYTIYLCNAFWGTTLTGTDSQAGTIIHELSHFTVVAGTNDWIYGQAGAQSLAISNPANAASNADSHEYFAENTPFIDREVQVSRSPSARPVLQGSPSPRTVQGSPSPTVVQRSPSPMPASDICAAPQTRQVSSAVATVISHGAYRENEACAVLLEAPVGQTIRITFRSFDTEAGYDFVRIFDGSNTAASQLLAASGNSMPSAVLTSGNKAWVAWSSDSSVNGLGWNFDCVAVAPSSSSPSPRAAGQGSPSPSPRSGSQDSPSPRPATDICVAPSIRQVSSLTAVTVSHGAYQVNEACAVQLQAPVGQSIRITFRSFDTELGYDFVRIFDGSSASFRQLLAASGTSLPAVVLTSGNNAFVTWNSDNSVSGLGWSFDCIAVPSSPSRSPRSASRSPSPRSASRSPSPRSASRSPSSQPVRSVSPAAVVAASFAHRRENLEVEVMAETPMQTKYSMRPVAATLAMLVAAVLLFVGWRQKLAHDEPSEIVEVTPVVV